MKQDTLLPTQRSVARANSPKAGLEAGATFCAGCTGAALAWPFAATGLP
jgi:hypothetical protein